MATDVHSEYATRCFSTATVVTLYVHCLFC